jgi:acyl carrier protein
MNPMTTTTPDVASEVRAYIVDRFLFGQNGDRLANGDSFLERHLVDSTGILEVVMFLEQRYGIKVADDELIPDNLDTIDRIAAFVARKQA